MTIGLGASQGCYAVISLWLGWALKLVISRVESLLGLLEFNRACLFEESVPVRLWAEMRSFKLEDKFYLS